MKKTFLNKLTATLVAVGLTGCGAPVETDSEVAELIRSERIMVQLQPEGLPMFQLVFSERDGWFSRVVAKDEIMIIDSKGERSFIRQFQQGFSPEDILGRAGDEGGVPAFSGAVATNSGNRGGINETTGLSGSAAGTARTLDGVVAGSPSLNGALQSLFASFILFSALQCNPGDLCTLFGAGASCQLEVSQLSLPVAYAALFCFVIAFLRCAVASGFSESSIQQCGLDVEGIGMFINPTASSEFEFE